METVWGWHLIIDIEEGRKDLVTSKKNIREFATYLVKAIDMVAYGKPMVVHFADHMPDKAGWSLVQLIETSNITAHFCDLNGDGYVDIFSCKEYNEEIAIDTVRKFFKPKRMKTKLIKRGVKNG
jgi:S-adenosylmethionine/arginine decarboxylase-like enzyme